MASAAAAAPGLSTAAIERKAEDFANGNTTATSWSQPGAAAFDFRSDVVTTPTTSMLTAVASTSLLDDVFCEDTTTNSLEAFIAKLAGHEAALLVLSGTMGNQLALRTHLGAPPHGILADRRSHIMEWEAGGIASLSGAMAQPVTPANGHHLTLEDVQQYAVVSSDVHACPTRIIALENTLNGTILPLDEVKRISAWAKQQDPPIIMHLDGARLWEAAAAGAGKVEEYCAQFDSVSLCFSKGLGAPIGSIITGTKKFITRARWVRKSIGGGLRQAGVIAAPARVAVEETFLGGVLQQTHVRARAIASMWEELGGTLEFPTETNMVWLDLQKAGITKDAFIALGVEHGVRLLGGRLVVHYQIGDEAATRLKELMRVVLEGKKQANGVGKEDVEGMKITVE